MSEWDFHCRFLGVSPEASETEIRRAFRESAKLIHPDKHEGSAVAKERFQQLQESFDFLIENRNTHFIDVSALHNGNGKLGEIPEALKPDDHVFMRAMIILMAIELLRIGYSMFQ